MDDLVIERRYNTDPETLFSFLSEEQHVAKWWGPEGTLLQDGDLVFGKSGGWSMIMRDDDSGSVHKVSGDIVEYDPPRKLRYTWGWHDEDDVRGHESEVSFTVEPDGDGVNLIMRHSGLEDEASRADHREGWESSISKLDKVFN